MKPVILLGLMFVCFTVLLGWRSGGFGGGGPGAAERPSGRGSLDDPDITQGREPDYLSGD